MVHYSMVVLLVSAVCMMYLPATSGQYGMPMMSYSMEENNMMDDPSEFGHYGMWNQKFGGRGNMFRHGQPSMLSHGHLATPSRGTQGRQPNINHGYATYMMHRNANFDY